MQLESLRYSDAEFVSILLTLGYKYSKIETYENKNKKFKVFFHFNEPKEILLDLDYQFRIGLLCVDILKFTQHLKTIKTIIKSELLQFRGKSLVYKEIKTN